MAGAEIPLGCNGIPVDFQFSGYSVLNNVEIVFEMPDRQTRLFLPMPMICQLQMPLRKKFGILLIVMTGALACVVSVIAIVCWTQYTTVYEDPTWKIIPIFPLGKSSFGQKVRDGLAVNSGGTNATHRKQMLKIASKPSMRGLKLEQLSKHEDRDSHSDLTLAELEEETQHEEV